MGPSSKKETQEIGSQSIQKGSIHVIKSLSATDEDDSAITPDSAQLASEEHWDMHLKLRAFEQTQMNIDQDTTDGEERNRISQDDANEDEWDIHIPKNKSNNARKESLTMEESERLAREKQAAEEEKARKEA